jgi:hypothetical protein
MNIAAPQASRTQRFASLAILSLLVAIALAVYQSQKRLNPAVRFQQALAVDTAAENSLRPAADLPDAWFAPPQPLNLFSPPEQFDAVSLADKINGKADLYLAAGFEQLKTQRMRLSEADARWIEVYLYNMGSPSNAFAVFSAQRRDDAAVSDLTVYAYQTGDAFYFVHGSHYVEMIAAEPVPELAQLFERLGRSIIEYLPAADQTADGQGSPGEAADWFPAQDRIDDSLTLVAQDAFGFDRFDDLYMTTYQDADQEMTAFVALRPSVQDAVELADAYRGMLTELGGQAATVVLGDISAQRVELWDTYEIVFTHGAFVAGVHEADDAASAEQLARRLAQHLIEVWHAVQ